jgi:glycosyltransferase involved in cell wall biosynthesis
MAINSIGLRKIKVIQLIPELNSGGVERGTLELGQYLSDQGHESIVVSNGGKLVEQLLCEGSNHIQIPVQKKNLTSLLQVTKLKELFEKERPDIVHARSRVPAWLSFFALKKIDQSIRPRFVTSVHGFYSVNPYSKIMTRGERVICVSQSIKDYVTTNYTGMDEQKLRIVQRGVNLNEFPMGYSPESSWIDEWRKSNPQTKGKFLVLLPGRITRWKGHLDFVKMVSRLKDLGIDAHGIFVGDAHPKKIKFKEELLASIRACSYPTSFSFLGTRSDLKEIMAVSDVVVSCSTDPEAFGRVTLEALSLGKAVAGYAHGGVDEQLSCLLPDGKIRVGDFEQMASLLSGWAKNKPSVSLNNKFTLQGMLDGELGVYFEMLGMNI